MGDRLVLNGTDNELMITRFAQVLLKHDDASGANSSMVKTMLAGI